MIQKRYTSITTRRVMKKKTIKILSKKFLWKLNSLLNLNNENKEVENIIK